MKKLMLIVALLVSLGLVGGVFAEPASAFFFKGGLFGAKGCGSGYGAYVGSYYAPYGYAGAYCAPYCAPYCGPVCGRKGYKGKGKAPAMAPKPAKGAPPKAK